MTRCQWVGAGVLGAKLHHFGAQARRVIGTGQPHKVGFSGVGKGRMHLNAMVDFLAFAFQFYQFVRGVHLHQKRQFAL